MIDRMVSADGGNPDPTTTHGKHVAEAKAIEQRGRDCPLDYPYGFASRFGDDRRGSNPEEIQAAAHAACFTMAFSFACEMEGFATRTLDTQAHVRLSAQGEGFVIDRIAPHLRAVVPGLDEADSRRSPVPPSATARCPRRWPALQRSACGDPGSAFATLTGRHHKEFSCLRKPGARSASDSTCTSRTACSIGAGRSPWRRRLPHGS
jgi:OsmC subfamily peroxiredoxin